MAVGLLTALALGAGSSLVGSGAQLGSQAWSQAYNAEQSQLNRDFQAQQAEINRGWLEKMQSNAYQRTVDDMEKAGINPATLAGGSTNATVPAGYSPQGASASVGVSNIGSLITNAFNQAIYANSHAIGEDFGKALENEGKMRHAELAKTLREIGEEKLLYK